MINKRHILIIAYSFYPDRSVAALRPKYWAESLIEEGFDVTVFTQSQLEPTDIGIRSEVNVKHIPLEPKKGFSLIADQGMRWKSPIAEALRKYDSDAFTSVIITGGPFMHMLLGEHIKSHFDTQLIIDFRDPFAINPRFNDSWIKKLVKKRFERQICRPANHVITVNKLTANLLQCDPNKVSILDNGFDEKLVDQIKSEEVNSNDSGCKRIIHTGKFYHPLVPTAVINAIQNRMDFEFVHYGDPLTLPKAIKNVFTHSFVPYRQVLKAINDCDIGLVLTNGEAFVSTTKIFDYIGLEKQVLIVTNGVIKTGNIHEITKENPNVFWSKNDKGEIEKTLNQMVKTPYTPFDTIPYSRGYQFRKLLNLLSKTA